MLPKTTMDRCQGRESHVWLAFCQPRATGERKVEFRMLQSELPEAAPSGTEDTADGCSVGHGSGGNEGKGSKLL